MQCYSSALEQAIAEQNTADNALERISSGLSSIQSLIVDALNIANHDKWSTLAKQLRITLNAIVEAANTTHGDIYIFAGTKNTASVLTPTPPETTHLPFEIVTVTPTNSNPSGLEVRFKGNNELRTVQIGDSSAEQVSTTANAIFGTGGTAMFETLISPYDTLAYNADGTIRSDGQLPNPEQLDRLGNFAKQLADASTTVNATTAELGIRTERMTSLQAQMQEDITRQRSFLSQLSDTDVAQATLQLQRDQIAYEYSLRVSARLLNLSLFDFLQ